MAITYHTEDIKMPGIDTPRTTDWIKKVAESFGKKCGDIAYIFCSDNKILEVNNTYLQHDYYTDIITFDYSQKGKISGDIFISIDTVESNAKEFDVTFDEELDRIIIHGILHLCGIDDKGPGERENMTKQENIALAIREHK